MTCDREHSVVRAERAPWRVISVILWAMSCSGTGPGIGNRGGSWPGGIGVTLRHRPSEGVLVVDRVPPEGSAERAGLREGDRITSIDGTAVEGRTTEAVVRSLRGEVGTTVRLEVLRDGVRRVVTVERAPYLRRHGLTAPP